MTYKYSILVDGNGMFFVRRRRAGFFGFLSTPTYAKQIMACIGINTSPGPAYRVEATDRYKWMDEELDGPHYTKFTDVREAVKALTWLRDRDREELQADEVSTMIEETL